MYVCICIHNNDAVTEQEHWKLYLQCDPNFKSLNPFVEVEEHNITNWHLYWNI